MLTLLQTGKRDIVPVVLLDAPGGEFWLDFQKYVEKRLLGQGMISPEDFSLYRLTDNVEAAVGEILTFFRVFHSMRYVKNKLVLRLKEPPTPAMMEDINCKFADILTAGEFQLTGPLPEEHDETDLSAYARLVFRFNRRSLGRLRQLIDLMNQVVTPNSERGFLNARNEAMPAPNDSLGRP